MTLWSVRQGRRSMCSEPAFAWASCAILFHALLCSTHTYTQYGLHGAEFVLCCDGFTPSHILSSGLHTHTHVALSEKYDDAAAQRSR